MGPVSTYSRDAGSPISCVHSKPKHGQDSPADDGKVTEPVSVAGARRDWERYVQVGTNCAIQYCWYGIANTCNESDEHSISCCQSWSHNPWSANQIVMKMRRNQPRVMMADPELHVEIVTRSETQYVIKAPFPQVLLSGGTGSMSALVQTSDGAMLLDCLGSFQLEGCATRSLAFSTDLLSRCRSSSVSNILA